MKTTELQCELENSYLDKQQYKNQQRLGIASRILPSLVNNMPVKQATETAFEYADALLESVEGMKREELPDSIPWHNPHNLTPEQVGVKEGWRLALEEEVCDHSSPLRGKVQAWVTCGPSWDNESIYACSSEEVTYRTKESLPEKYRHLVNKTEDEESARKRHVAEFLRKCFHVAFVCPISGTTKYLSYGKCEGLCELNDKLKLDYYNGETHKLKNVLCIYPSMMDWENIA